MKKMLTMLLAVLMLFGTCTAMAEGFPIVEEPLEVTMWAAFTEMQTEWEDMYVWGAYEDKTNIHVNWDLIDWTVVDEQMQLLLASGDEMPDAFYKCYAEVDVVNKYGEEGAFLALNDYIDQYMPNYKALMDKYDLWKSYEHPDSGNIYSIGMIDGAMANRIGTKLFLNQRWMENCGITEMPTTLDEFVDVLRAFRDMDANGNGDPNDEIPLTTTNIWAMLQPFYGCFGVANRGAGHAYINYSEETQDIEFTPVSNNWRDLFRFANLLWEEGLIDPGIFNQQTTSILALSDEDRIGSIAFVNVDAYITTERVDDFVALGEALEGPYGKSVNNVSAPYNTYIATAFILSADCKYPAELCKWIDYFYSEEGSEFIFWGVEGDTFTWNEETGRRDWSDWVLNAEGATSYDLLYSRIMPWSGGAMPCYTLDTTMSSGETRGQGYVAAVNMAPYVIDEVWPSFSYTEEESERNGEIWANMIVNHYDPMFAAFMKGEADIDDDAVWAEYVAKYSEYGMEEWMDIYRAAKDRFFAE